MKKSEDAKERIMKLIYLQIEDDIRYGKIYFKAWREVIDKEYLESFAFIELVKASENISDEVEYARFVREILSFVKRKKYEILKGNFDKTYMR